MFLPQVPAEEGAAAAGGSGKPTFAVTTPDALTEAIRARLAELGSGPGASAEGPVAPDTALGGHSRVLPSGEDEAEALRELLDVVCDYSELAGRR